MFTEAYRGPEFSRLSLQLVREPGLTYDDMPEIVRPAEVVAFLWDRVFSTLDREAVVALYFDTAQRVIGWSLVYVGTLNAARAEPRGFVVPALLCNAASLLVAHNHPSGSPHPSDSDRIFSYQLAAACHLLGLKLLDSFVIAEPGRGGAPRWTRIDWPGKGGHEGPPILYAIQAGLIPDTQPTESQMLHLYPDRPRR